ncbi:MAG: sigma-70 family RNA polymerase sigma factor [Planctomycetota bacterium]
MSAHGDALYAYARLRLPDAESAEDAVQATLLAALERVDGYRGQASERTWLVGILRHKIADALRERYRDERRRGELARALGSVEGEFSDGRWSERRPAWRMGAAGAPGGSGAVGVVGDDERREFRRALLACLDALPPAMRDVLVLRELEELETEAICEVLGITPTNLWTLVHRAKAKLRKELTRRWFDREDASSGATSASDTDPSA